MERREQEDEHREQGDPRGNPERHQPPAVLHELDPHPATGNRLPLGGRDARQHLVQNSGQLGQVLADAEIVLVGNAATFEHRPEPEIREVAGLDDIGGVHRIGNHAVGIPARDCDHGLHGGGILLKHAVWRRSLQHGLESGVAADQCDLAPAQSAQLEQHRGVIAGDDHVGRVAVGVRVNEKLLPLGRVAEAHQHVHLPSPEIRHQRQPVGAHLVLETQAGAPGDQRQIVRVDAHELARALLDRIRRVGRIMSDAHDRMRHHPRAFFWRELDRPHRRFRLAHGRHRAGQEQASDHGEEFFG